MKATRAATLAARLIGILTLGWAWLAYKDLRWLLHVHFIHVQVLHTPFAFSYHPYLACAIANLVAPIVASGLLLLSPYWLLGMFTPRPGKGRLLSTGWFAVAVGIGLGMLVVSIHGILATALWTIFSSGRDSGWKLDLLSSALIAACGVILCRKAMAGRCESGSAGVLSTD